MAKKVLISTWVGVTSLNYGSALQATALQECVRRLGYKVQTVNNQFAAGTRFQCMLNIKKHEIQKGKEYSSTKRKFARFFRKNTKLSPICFNDKDVVSVAQKADILMCGSDAIWKNQFICPLFTWDYPELNKYPKIAYAASVAMGDIKYDMKHALETFTAISGREKQVEEMVGEFTNLPIKTVIDPTLLVDKSYWNDLSAERLIQEEYILCYMLSDAEMHRLSVEDVKRKYGTDKVVYINTNWIDRDYGFTDAGSRVFNGYGAVDFRDDDYKNIVGPNEFLSLIKYAKAVCTDSFHGMALSIVFNKDFYAFPRESMWSADADFRFQDMFKRLGFDNRFILKNQQIRELQDIDWNVINKNWEKEQQKSMEFLKNSLAKATEICDSVKK